MSYFLGVDLGTSYTAAATARDGRVDIASLGNSSATIPSVVLLKEDHTILTGDAADRRSLMEPGRVAREFKRRVGDTTPIFLGGAPQSAEALMARLLRWVADEVATREGGPAARVTICHPANWGQYKKDLLVQAVRIAELGSADYITEPEAAAIHYASNQRVETGAIIAVYDLGGGTFDAAVLRKSESGFEILGEPEGIERLGGIDFDAAVFAHVARSLGGRLEELDEDDPTSMAAVARLKTECTQAKEGLSSDTDVSIQVMLPNIQTDVRLTRTEFEAMIRPSLNDTIAAMRRALASANVDIADVSTVLLAGGSSRIPVVAQIVGAELGRPVAVDAHPKHAVALGAALSAASHARETAAPTAAPAAAAPIIAAPVVAATTQMPNMGQPTAPQPLADAPTEQQPVVPGPPTGPGMYGGVAPALPPRSKLPMILSAVGVVAVVLIGAFVVFARGGGNDTTASTVVPATTELVAEPTTPPATEVPVTEAPLITEPPVTEPPIVTTAAPTDAELEAGLAAEIAAIDPNIIVRVVNAFAAMAGEVDQETSNAAVIAASGYPGLAGVNIDELIVRLPDELCTDAIKAFDRWACIDSVTFDGTNIEATYIDPGIVWDLGGFHVHFFSDAFEPAMAGAPSNVSKGGAPWIIWSEPITFSAKVGDLGGTTIDRLCVRVATSAHTLESLESGNCFPVTNI